MQGHNDRRCIPPLARPRGLFVRAPAAAFVGEYSVRVEEGDRQMLLMGLAELVARYPGWDLAVRLVAEKFPDGAAELQRFIAVRGKPVS